MNPLVGFDLSDGFAGHDGCRLWLTGEQLNPTEMGVLMYSGDGGKTVQSLASFPQAMHLWQVALSQDSTTIWLAGDSMDGNGLLLKSVDGGTTWHEVTLPVSTAILTALALTENSIWVAGRTVGSAMLLMSADGGETWQEALRITSPGPPPQWPEFSEIAIADSTIMAVGDDGAQAVIAVSRDGGATFQLAPELGEFNQARNVSLIDTEHAYVGGFYSPNGSVANGTAVFLRTMDGGRTWEKLPTPDNALVIVDSLFTSLEHGFALTGSLLHSVNFVDGQAPMWDVMPLIPLPSFGGPSHLVASGDGTLYAIGIGGTGVYRIKP